MDTKGSLAKKMKTKVFLVILLSVLFSGIQLFSCTIFYVVKGDTVFAGNNEDWENPDSKMWFYLPENNKHGWIKFGWGSGFPQGGMNDQGLFWDASSAAFLAMPESEENKEKYSGALMQTVIEECANIEEALEVFANYYCEDQYKAQYLIGDSQGKSIIVEGDHILEKDSSYQILTNFYHSHPDLGGYPCWRYERANELLRSSSVLTPYYIGSILAATHQEGKYPTQYSTIYDLKNKQVYLFHFHNYEEYIKIDLLRELNKGQRSFNIPDLFSSVKMLTPSEGEKMESTSVTLTWEGLTGNNYEVILSTDPEFKDIPPKYRANTNQRSNNQVGFLYFLQLLLLFPFVKRKQLMYSSITILLVVLLNIQCKKSKSPPPKAQVVKISETYSNFLSDTTYYGSANMARSRFVVGFLLITCMFVLRRIFHNDY
jgi:penicillin V acylase-like amidase (Ntn superfamily)